MMYFSYPDHDRERREENSDLESDRNTRLDSDRFPIDAIIEHNRRVVDSAKQTIRETQKLIAHVVCHQPSIRSRDRSESTRSSPRRFTFDKENSCETNEVRVLPNISRFFEPIDTHTKHNSVPTYRSEPPPLYSFKDHMKRNINGDADFRYGGHVALREGQIYRQSPDMMNSNHRKSPNMDKMYRELPNMEYKDSDNQSNHSYGMISPTIAPTLVSPTESRSSSTGDSYRNDQHTETNYRPISLPLITIPNSPDIPNKSDLPNRENIDSVVNLVCSQFKAQVENMLLKSDHVSLMNARNLNVVGQSMMKELSRVLTHHKELNDKKVPDDTHTPTVSRRSPLFSDHKDTGYNRVRADTLKEYERISLTYDRSKDHPLPPVCRPDYSTKHTNRPTDLVDRVANHVKYDSNHDNHKINHDKFVTNNVKYVTNHKNHPIINEKSHLQMNAKSYPNKITEPYSKSPSKSPPSNQVNSSFRSNTTKTSQQRMTSLTMASQKHSMTSQRHSMTSQRHSLTSQKHSLTSQTKKRGYLCHQCGKVYCRKYVLKIHQRVHSGEKPLLCPVCGKCFSDPSNMKKHVKLHDHHHEAASFSCNYCRRQFATRKGLMNHLNSVHARELGTSNGSYSPDSV